MEIYHRQAANLNDRDQNFEFIFGENNNYHQIGNAYLQNEMTIEKDDAYVANRALANVDVIRLVNTVFAYRFKEARVSTTGSSDIEHNKFRGQVSTILRSSKSKGVDFFISL